MPDTPLLSVYVYMCESMGKVFKIYTACVRRLGGACAHVCPTSMNSRDVLCDFECRFDLLRLDFLECLERDFERDFFFDRRRCESELALDDEAPDDEDEDEEEDDDDEDDEDEEDEDEDDEDDDDDDEEDALASALSSSSSSSSSTIGCGIGLITT